MGQPGSIDMATAVVAAYGTALGDAGTRLDEKYTTYNADISHAIPGIGTGEILSDTFRPTHDPDARWVREVAAQLPAQFDRLADAATKSAADYEYSPRSAPPGIVA